MKYLLDTAAFWWLATDATQLSSRAREIFANTGNEIFLSSISIWELLLKHQLGKLPINRPLASTLATVRSRVDLRSLPFKESAAMQLSRLPDVHRGPFDRMLICQALEENLTLLTLDRQIHAYPVAAEW